MAKLPTYPGEDYDVAMSYGRPAVSLVKPSTSCQYDSGSMTGCRPLCDRPATVRGSYANGSYGPFLVDLCDRHVLPFRARVAGLFETHPIGRR
jgi:hypothetical protein